MAYFVMSSVVETSFIARERSEEAECSKTVKRFLDFARNDKQETVRTDHKTPLLGRRMPNNYWEEDKSEGNLLFIPTTAALDIS